MLNKEKIMYKYKVQVKKVSGRLNESVLPSKNLIVKSKTKKSKSAVLTEASKFFKKKYGLVIESGDVMKNETNQYFISTWGHEQTNVDFYKVLKMSNSSVTLIEVKSKHSHNDKGWGHYSATPTDEVAPYAEPFRKKYSAIMKVFLIAKFVQENMHIYGTVKR